MLSVPLWLPGTEKGALGSGLDDWTRHSGFAGVQVWTRGWFASEPELQERVTAELPGILASPLFKGRVPEAWSILLDNVPHGLSGFWSPSTKDPEGHPAILIRPSDFMDPALTRGLIAHELGHLMHGSLRPQETSWVREGIAMTIQSRITHHPHACLRASLTLPGTSLTSALDPTQPDYAVAVDSSTEHCAQYGHIFQFFSYVERLCGGEALFEELLTSKSPESDIAFVDAVLRARAPDHALCKNFETAFRAFETARFAADPSDPERYAILTQDSIAVRETPAKQLAPYSAQAYWLRQARGEHLSSPRDCRRGDVALDRERCLQIRLN